MVDIQAESTLRDSSASPSARNVLLTRALISLAALSVKVMAMISSMEDAKGPPSEPDPSSSAQAMRWVSVNVLPLPAPAATNKGASSVSTQTR